MGISVKGNSSYKFSLDAANISITGLTVESATLREAAQVDEEGIGEDGLVKAWAIGGDQWEASVTGYLTGGSPPSIGSSATVGGKACTVTGVEKAYGNRDWHKATVTLKGYEGIS